MIKNIIKKYFSLFCYLIFILLILLFFDIYIFKKILGFGYQTYSYDEKVVRKPFPYVMFKGAPNVKDHNELGYRGRSFHDSNQDDLKIAFYGGSTGYNGDPTIAQLIENTLTEKLKRKIFVANFSSVSSNHNQHVHSMVDDLFIFKPDIVLFYGGFNELEQRLDPRPGYPYNYFYRAELHPLKKLLIRYSATAGELEKAYSILSSLDSLRKEVNFGSTEWDNAIIDNYFTTLLKAKQISDTFCRKTSISNNFLGVHQPFQNRSSSKNKGFYKIIDNQIKNIYFIHNFSDAYDSLDNPYRDVVHVNQEAKRLMAQQISNLILVKMEKNK